MPLYVYNCEPCRKDSLDVRTIEERHLSPKCDGCGKPMKLQISAVTGIVRNPAAPKKN